MSSLRLLLSLYNAHDINQFEPDRVLQLNRSFTFKWQGECLRKLKLIWVNHGVQYGIFIVFRGVHVTCQQTNVIITELKIALTLL